MAFTICDMIQFALVVLQFVSDLQCKNRPENPSVVAMNCQNTINQEFHTEYVEMIKLMKDSIDPQISKQIKQIAQQPDFNYINYFKYDMDFVAQFVMSRIERAHEQVNYNQFFNQVSDCRVCEKQNQTSRNCLKDIKFRKDFVNTSIRLFNEYPLKIEKKKFETIDEFKKKNDLKVLTGLYNEFLTMFNDSKYIELEMKNLIKNRLIKCCPEQLADELDL